MIVPESIKAEIPMARTNAAPKKDMSPATHVPIRQPMTISVLVSRRYPNHDDGPTPVGFGDDIPAFMLISAALK